jgi:hypothetical protein
MVEQREYSSMDENQLLQENIAAVKLQQSDLIDFQNLLRKQSIEDVGEILLEGIYGESDFMKKDTIDRFLDYVFLKCVTGDVEIPSMKFPIKRMMDRELEGQVKELINVHLYPEIILRLMKLFTRNLHDADSNLYIANLIESKAIVRSLFETYKLFVKDIFIPDRDKRCRNVKMLQQFSARSHIKLSSPLDAAARMKYILEYLHMKLNYTEIYTLDDLKLEKGIPPKKDYPFG